MFKRFGLIILISILLVWFGINRLQILMYTNPYTNTAVFGYISPTIKNISKYLDEAKDFSENEGYKYKYVFLNPYGSGFLKHNPIPNDLDMEVGIDLGNYSYDGKNGKEIAEDIVNKINNFEYYFNYAINSSDKGYYITENSIDILNKINEYHDGYVYQIYSSFNNVINERNYIKYVHKIFTQNRFSYKVDFPYILSSNEILLTGFRPTVLLTDDMKYGKNTKVYLREISLIPQFYIHLEHSGKVRLVEIIPESYFGARLHLKRRFFASSIFANEYSYNYLKTNHILNDDEQFVFFRLLSFKRHLIEIENIVLAGYDRPIKIYKRIMQAANMVRPLLDDETYSEIEEYVERNLSNEDLQLLNEYENICASLQTSQRTPGLLLRLIAEGKIQPLYDFGTEIIQKLEENNNIDKKYLEEIKTFHKTKFLKLVNAKTEPETILLKTDESYLNLKHTITNAILPLMQDKDKIDKTVKIFNNIFTDMGYHKTYLYWLNTTTVGILSDKYTSQIKDLNKFAKDNQLGEMNYKLINKSQIPPVTLKYEVWTRYNPTEKEIKNFEETKQKLIKDKKNFNIKRRFILR